MCWYKKEKPSGNSSNGAVSTGYKPKPITCFICGQPGHKSPDCPEKGKGTKQVKKEVESVRIRSISVLLNGRGRKNTAQGTVNGKVRKILIDSGADKAVVPHELVAPTAYTGRLAMCEGAVRGIRAIAVVNFEFEGKHFKREAVVTTGVDDFQGCLFDVDFNNL